MVPGIEHEKVRERDFKTIQDVFKTIQKYSIIYNTHQYRRSWDVMGVSQIWDAKDCK